MNRFFALLLLAIISSCVSPDEIEHTPNPDMIVLDQLFTFSGLDQSAYEFRKQVTLDDQSESSIFPLDTTIIQQDLKLLREYSFAHMVRKASYDKVEDHNRIIYERKEKEKRGPVVLQLEKSTGGDMVSVSMRFEHHNYLYHSTQEISINFQNNRPTRYLVIGNRSFTGLSQSSYRIDAEIVGI